MSESDKKQYLKRNRVRRLGQAKVERALIKACWAVDTAGWGPDMSRHFEMLNQIVDDLAVGRAPSKNYSKLHQHLHRLFGSMLAEVEARRRALKSPRGKEASPEAPKPQPAVKRPALATTPVQAVRPPVTPHVEKPVLPALSMVKPEPSPWKRDAGEDDEEYIERVDGLIRAGNQPPQEKLVTEPLRSFRRALEAAVAGELAEDTDDPTERWALAMHADGWVFEKWVFARRAS